MGGDYGSKVVIPAALSVLKDNPDLQLIFVGLKDQIEPLLKKHGAALADRWQIQHASEVVAMDELPSQALRTKKDSSMRVAINLVKEGKADACVSAGNTGALMATARFVLRTLPGIDRPAIMARFPTETDKEVRVLDVGANVDSTAEQLFQFAVMASILTTAVENISYPTVGLLNIGAEEIKGTEQVKRAAELLSNSNVINYAGYIEGNDIFTGAVDVVVCDGFVGNVALKACEGTAKLITNSAKKAFMQNWLTKLSAMPAMPVLKRLVKRMDPRRRNGASFLGLNGIVIKSHGGADELAFACAVQEAIVEIDKNIPELLRQQVRAVLLTNDDTSSNS